MVIVNSLQSSRLCVLVSLLLLNRGPIASFFTVPCRFIFKYWISTGSVRRLRLRSSQTTACLYSDPQNSLSDVVTNRPERKRIFFKPACSRKVPKISAKTIMLWTITFDQRVLLECPSGPRPSSCRIRRVLDSSSWPVPLRFAVWENPTLSAQGAPSIIIG